MAGRLLGVGGWAVAGSPGRWVAGRPGCCGGAAWLLGGLGVGWLGSSLALWGLWVSWWWLGGSWRGLGGLLGSLGRGSGLLGLWVGSVLVLLGLGCLGGAPGCRAWGPGGGPGLFPGRGCWVLVPLAWLLFILHALAHGPADLGWFSRLQVVHPPLPSRARQPLYIFYICLASAARASDSWSCGAPG